MSSEDAACWRSLKPALNNMLCDVLEKDWGFTSMTPVQAAVIPLFYTKDVVVQAVTGSGKTLAFLLPIVQDLLSKESGIALHSIIVSPTRDLAQQTYTVFQQLIGDIRKYDPEVNIQAQLITGGISNKAGEQSSITKDIEYFRQNSPAVLIATPGRLIHLLTDYAQDFNLKNVDFAVLDEADRLLDTGFAQQVVGSVLSKLPKQRRTALFSATMSDAMGEVVKAGLRNPVKVVVKVEHFNQGKLLDHQVIPEKLKVTYLACPLRLKFLQFCRLLCREPQLKWIVYFSTCACVDYFHKILDRMKYTSQYKLRIMGLHGKMDMKKRNSVYQEFSSSTSGVLLCTDLAARGLDLPDVDRVLQYDPPQDPRVFAHRCGRTARAGREGQAFVLLNEGCELLYVEFLKIRKIPITQHPLINHELQLYESDTPSLEKDHDEAKMIRNEIWKHCSKDLDLHEKGMRAFVSFIQSYAKHEASFIFRSKELNIPAAAFCFGLLKLPKMPELKEGTRAKALEEFEEWAGSIESIPYSDKAREKQRRLNAAAKVEKLAISGEKINAKRRKAAWSEQKEKKIKRQVNREKRERKRAYIAKNKEIQPEAKGNEDDADDLEELRKEANLLKKVKKGKLSMKKLEEIMDQDGDDLN